MAEFCHGRVTCLAERAEGGTVVFDGLGIDADAADVYLTLLTHHVSTTTEVTAALGWSARRVARAFGQLAELGLVSMAESSRPRRFSVRDPHEPITALLVDRENELTRARTDLSALSEAYRAAGLGDDRQTLIEVVTGSAEITQRILTLAASTRYEVCTLDRPPYISMLSDASNLEQQSAMLERGLGVRCIYDTKALDDPTRLAHVRLVAAAGEQARTLADVPVKMHLFDRSAAIVPLAVGAGIPPSVAVVHRSGMLEGLVALFDELWSRARPLFADEDADRDKSAHLRRLLAGGLSDQAVARSLGVSERTLARRIAGLYDEVGARTRYQAGFVAGLRAAADAPSQQD